MHSKIKEALKQGYKNLGLDDAAFEGVASLIKPFINDEAQIGEFVKGAEQLLKKFQSDADKYRTLESKYNALNRQEPQPNPNPEPEPEPEPKPKPEPDLASLIQQAIAQAVQPLNEKLSQMEQQAASKSAFATAKDSFFANDYVKQYKDESNDAWERANELNEATGSKMTAEELQTKAMGYFNKAVSRKGVDTSKPFEAKEPSKEIDFSDQAAILENQGVNLYREPKK